ncbi:MAG TPA: hydrogenase maturation nickel metallochaperone HypA [Mycobacteriales bacterium]|nr:hydrogenase maturation nickel metallochaperone HypA [Mycobacteriales bacterium]
MHELGITQSVVAAVSERMPEAKVVRVRLEIGRLAGVVADSVRFCFDAVTAGTGLEGARLEIVEPAGQARCRQCDAVSEFQDLLLLCECGSADLEVLAGTQLLIKEVEVA